MKPNNKEMKIIESALLKIYFKYKNKGLLSIYLWGTVLTNDFNPDSSDIDSIAIVSSKANKKDNNEINKFLKDYCPEYKDFKLNYLYLDELDGKRIKSRLARVMDPRLLLLDFKNWKHVSGKKYSRKDFKLKEINLDEAIKLNLFIAKKRFLPLFKKDNFEHTQYFVKRLIKICYHLNQRDFGKHNFRYNELLKKSPKERKKVVKILLEIKKSKWDESLMKKNFSFLRNFIEEVDI